MGLISEGIDCARVFELPAGIWANGRIAALPRVCIVKWRSTWSDKIHQIYAGGKFAGATADGEQRQIVIQTPSCEGRAVRIEVFAVTPEEANVDYSDELEDGLPGQGRLRLSFQKQATDTRFEVYYDKGTGAIDYANIIGEVGIGVNCSETIEWVSMSLEAGIYKFAIRAFDGNENAREAIETGEIVVIPAAKPVRELKVLSFDEVENELVLQIEE